MTSRNPWCENLFGDAHRPPPRVPDRIFQPVLTLLHELDPSHGRDVVTTGVIRSREVFPSAIIVAFISMFAIARGHGTHSIHCIMLSSLAGIGNPVILIVMLCIRLVITGRHR